MNPNIEYEKFAQEIYQGLLDAENVKTIKVQHDVKLCGKSGQEHQIDVYWEYELAGVKHRVVIECKNYKRTVSIGEVRDFYGVIDDLTNVAGVMVTQVGYQSGAKKYAGHNGINLKELRPPNESDGMIGQLETTINMAIRSRLFLVDEEWAKANDLNFTNYRNFLASFKQDDGWLNTDYIPLETPPNTNIVNKKDELITTFEKLEGELPPEGTVPEYIFSFKDAYVDTTWGPLKIKEVKYLYRKDKQTTVFGLHAMDFVKAILKDALNSDIKFIGKY